MGAAATCSPPEVADCSPGRCVLERFEACDRKFNGNLSSQYTSARATLSRIVIPTTANFGRAEEEVATRERIPVGVIGRGVREFAPNFGAEDSQLEEQVPKASKALAKRKVNERLIEAAREGNCQKAAAAISDGAEVNFETLRKQTPLIVCATSFHKTTNDLVNLLLEMRASIEARDDQGWTPLLHACRNNQKEVCALLLENKAMIKARSNDGKTVTMLATLEKSDTLVVDLVVNHHAILDKADKRGWPILFFACEGGRQDLVKWLLNKMEVPVTDQAKDLTTPLMVAAATGHKNIGQQLLKRRAALNGQNLEGYTALMLALKAQKEDFAEWLLDARADPRPTSKTTMEDAIEIADSLGMNALHHKLVARVRVQEEQAEKLAELEAEQEQIKADARAAAMAEIKSPQA